MSRLAAVLAAALVALAACGGPSPSASPSPTATPAPTATPGASASPAAVGHPGAQRRHRRALPRRSRTRSWPSAASQAKQRLEPTILSEAEARARLEEQFRKDNPPDEIAVAEETLKALGLLPADASLGDLYVDLLGSQVAGFYDPKAKELFVVSRSGRIGATEKVTFAHEFTHALQDQAFGLEGIDVDAVGQGDRSLGRLAPRRGRRDAPHDPLAEPSTSPPRRSRSSWSWTRKPQAQLAKMPAILRETLLFPYQQGLIFATGIWAKGGWEAVDRAYGRLPDSTEQVLHPEKYEAGEKPVEVPLDAAALAKAMGAGWKETPADTLGEFQLSVWLRENGVKALAAEAAAAGWGGDRLAYLRGPAGAYALALRHRVGHAGGRGRVPRGGRDDGGRCRRCRARRDGPVRGAATTARAGVCRGRRRGDAAQRPAADDASPRADARRRLARTPARPVRRSAYIDSGAEIPRRPSAPARVSCVARTRASRERERSGSDGSTTRASR